MKTSVVYRNGQNSGALHSWPQMLHAGVGVFESMRARRKRSAQGGWLIGGLDLHLERLQRGIGELQLLEPGEHAVRTAIRLALTEADRGDAGDLRLRIVALVQDWFLIVEEWRDPWADAVRENGGIELVTVESERFRPHLKCCSALSSELARREAHSRKAHEALLVDGQGIVRECAWSNFFWVDGTGMLVTPRSSILPGVTRHLVLKAAERDMRVEQRDVSLPVILNEACEAFVTQATCGVVPVCSVDGIRLPAGAPGTVTLEVRARYEKQFE